MRICVLGAGLAGLACAWQLLRDGHEVVVLDREAGPGEGTSRANGGQLSYSYVAPLAAPGVTRKGVSWILDDEAPLRLRPQMDPRLWRWLMAFVRASRREVFEQGTRDMLALAYHSRDVLAALLAEAPLEFSYRVNGKLVVFRDPADLAGAARLVEFQARHGARQQVLDARECLALEPALADTAAQLAGGVHTPDEAVGDAHHFCLGLRNALAQRGATFLFGREATGLLVRNGAVAAALTAAGPVEADQFVLATGIGALSLAEPLGLSLPLYPLKGYSLTVPTRTGDRPPEVSITDAHHKVVYALLDRAAPGAEGRLRVAGMVDLVGFGTDLVERRVALLSRQAREVFPAAADWPRAEPWSGLRPATPDWKPILGESGIGRLWLNLGHGGLGFTIACGTGRILADLIAGREPAIPAAPYGLIRPKVPRGG
ncbi:D-amino acid dehydrogenase [Roseomonas sp. NAR14]|uniref:D-amino acid dehydrogenase n=1 Tax=Roseomonas acroporae TaxID=2937791 RepID=A0A9X1YDE4_9PROT|nr:D-amino acid dehydrogenase [Roseomonas acroporae]MCK8787747.1 D-amino acid dehydrogenase [Roseomonas acroporae]